MSRVGIDCDGVLCDFNETFINRVIQVTGEDRFPKRPFDITTWNYPESYGYSSAQVSAVWESIKADAGFWRSLKPYPDAAAALGFLWNLQRHQDHELYFITSRLGRAVKHQSEQWLQQWFPNPTVLISSQKGACARALLLDVYIDDKWENCVDAAWNLNHPSTTRTYLMDRPWNQRPDRDLEQYGIIRVKSVFDIEP